MSSQTWVQVLGSFVRRRHLRSLDRFLVCGAAAAVMLCTIRAGAEEKPPIVFTGAPAASLAGQLQGLPSQRETTPAGEIGRTLQFTDDSLLIWSRISQAPTAPDNAAATLAELVFRARQPHRDSPFVELGYRTEVWYESTFWTGPNWTRVGRNWHHPGEDTPSVRRYVASRDGTITISGPVRKFHLDGDGVRVAILHNDRELWHAELEGKDDKGIDPHLTVAIRKGECVRFLVHKRGNIVCDTTYWDPVITWENGETSTASECFSPNQGNQGWFYEMFEEKKAADPPLTVLTWGKDFAQRDALMDGKPFEFSGADSLPFAVIADPLTKSGVFFVVDSSERWKCVVQLNDAGELRCSLSALLGAKGEVAKDERLPTISVTSFQGPWTSCLERINSLLRDTPAAVSFPAAATELRSAWEKFTADSQKAGLQRLPDLDLLLMAQGEWRLDDLIADRIDSYEPAVRKHLQRSAALLADSTLPVADRDQLRAALNRIEDACRGANQDVAQWRRIYVETRMLKRAVLLASPLLKFPELVICKRVPPSYSHLVGQYYGWRQRPGGGIFVLSSPGYSTQCRSVLQQQLPPGDVLEPRLSYDAKRIVFSYVACRPSGYDPTQLLPNEEGPDEGYFHIFETQLDGKGLRQLTSGTYDDMMPAYLPGGEIVFTSTRRRSYSRCFGPAFSRRWDSYTLHRMAGDGSGLRQLSANDVNDWFPAVSNQGHLLFARWDYIDRDAVTHQNLWSSRPDGSNPAAVWGNAVPKPHCSFQARSIPGSSKIVFIASAHHAITAGPVCVMDPEVDPNSEAAITRITPVPFPEAESSDIREYYNSPWPLSESLFLVAYSRDRLRFEGEHPSDPNPDNALGIYLLHASGDRELIYRDPRISSTTPMPLQPTPVPPEVTNTLLAGDAKTGEVMIADVYCGLGNVPRGTIKQLRVVQIFPKTTPLANTPRIGIAGEENARAILGTVPVESDGSARFVMPADKPVLFQALDEQGNAYQTMRSTTYVQAGERVSCVGCHEPRMSTMPTANRLPLAFRREPSRLEPGDLGGRPFSFTEMIQPVLNENCVRCHGGEKTDGGVDLTATWKDGFTKAYWALCAEPAPGSPADRGLLVPRYAQRNQVQVTPPGGAQGARGSRLMKLLREGHEKVQLSDRDLRRVATWIDLNATFYGVYLEGDLQRQRNGEQVAMPAIQ